MEAQLTPEEEYFKNTFNQSRENVKQMSIIEQFKLSAQYLYYLSYLGKLTNKEKHEIAWTIQNHLYLV